MSLRCGVQCWTQDYNHSMARMRLLQPAFPIIIALLVGLQLMESSRVWIILLVGFGGIFVTAYFWALTLGRNFHLRRENNLGWVQVGGQIEERFTLSNDSLVPAPWIQFIDQSTLPEFNASRSTGLGTEFFDQWTINATCKQRGLFYLGDAKIQTGDPFGIFDVTIHVPQRTSILVLPQVTTLPDLSITPAGSFGDGRPRRNAPEQTIHASTVREYAYGDSTRLIHWPTTARTKKVFVRLLESAPEGNWWILLDLDKQYMLGKGWDSIEEQSVALAASLTDTGLRTRKSVGLISNGAEFTWLTPKKSEGQRWEVMQALALAKPSEFGLSTVLERIKPSLGKHHSLIVITTSTKLDWLQTLLTLTKSGIMPTIILLDGSTFGVQGSAENTAAVLMQHNFTCHIIPRGTIKPPKALPQQRGNWKWRSLSTGEIVLVQN
jgi:uncharacterized protein (DUF58 family)